MFLMTRLRTYGYVLLCGVLLIAVRAYAVEISGVEVTEVTNTSATVKWKTDINADATINYGLNPQVGVVRDPLFNKKDHSLIIDDLDPSTTYYFRVLSSDVEGNKSSTAGYVFTTAGSDNSKQTEKIKDQEQKALTERILDDLSQVTDPQAVVTIAEKVKQVAQDVLKPPVILGATKIVADTTSAEISWTTDRESSSMVYLAPDSEFNPDSSDPYTIVQGDPNETVTRHTVNVIGLDPSTTYHFKVVSEDSLGLSAETLDDTFKTRSLLPRVQNVSVTRVQENSAVVNWSTGGVKAKGVIEYKNMRTNVTKSAGIPVYATNQSLQLAGLEFGTRYTGVIIATNEGGENVTSDPFSFVTVRDVIAPEISKVNNESTLFPGEDTKIQTIMSWETDEPAMCQVFYTQGLVLPEGETGESMLPEPNPTTSHTQVIVGFAPATVYKFWMICKDESLNESRSEDFVLITPVKEKNIIDIILENFEGTFGWVKNIAG